MPTAMRTKRIGSHTRGISKNPLFAEQWPGRLTSRAAVYERLSHSTRKRFMRAGESHIFSGCWRAARMVTSCAPSTRSGCQNIKLAIASYDGVPCRNGHTSSLTLRHLGTDTPRSTGLYAGS